MVWEWIMGHGSRVMRVTGQLTDWWVTWVTGHKMWPIVSSEPGVSCWATSSCRVLHYCIIVTEWIKWIMIDWNTKHKTAGKLLSVGIKSVTYVVLPLFLSLYSVTSNQLHSTSWLTIESPCTEPGTCGRLVSASLSSLPKTLSWQRYNINKPFYGGRLLSVPMPRCIIAHTMTYRYHK